MLEHLQVKNARRTYTANNTPQLFHRPRIRNQTGRGHRRNRKAGKDKQDDASVAGSSANRGGLPFP